MKMTIRIFTIFLICLNAFYASGQVSIRSANISKRTDLKSICQLIILNQTQSPINAKIHIEILYGRNGNLICELESSNITAVQGLYYWFGDISTFSRISYGNNPLGQKFKNYGTLSGAPIEVCYNLYVKNTEEKIGFLCEELNPFGSAAVQLMKPSDKEMTEECYPVLRWTLGANELNSVSDYSIVLADLEGHRNASDAIKKGPYNFYNTTINQNFLVLNPITARLVDGHWYAWQVGTYQNGKMENESEIFTFKYQCKELDKNVAFTLSADTSYRVLKRNLDDSYYSFTTNTLPLSIVNNHPDTSLILQVYPASSLFGSPVFSDTIKNLRPGINYYKKAISGINHGEKYILKAQNLSRTVQYLRFKYL
jgi:hypothetical protein